MSTTGDVYDASVVGYRPDDDIAVLQLTGASGLATIPLGDSDSVKVGDPGRGDRQCRREGRGAIGRTGNGQRAASADHRVG